MTAEAELVKNLRDRNARAFELLVSKYGAMLYRVAARIVGEQEAEEVIQDTLLGVYEKIDQFNGRSTLGTWLYRIVVNNALMLVRARSRLREEPGYMQQPELTPDGDFAGSISGWSISPEDAVLRREAMELLRRNIARLPETYRSVYVLAEIEGLSHSEIASVLGLSMGSVKIRLHRARLCLRGVLASYFTAKAKSTRKKTVGGEK